MTQESQTSGAVRGIGVVSDWGTTVGMIVILVVCGLPLIRDTEHFILGDVAGPAHVQRSFWSKVFETLAAIYGFMFAFIFSQKSVKVAGVLVGLKMGSYALLSCFNISPNVRHVVAVSGSIAIQIALAIFCVAIVQWLKCVVRWEPPPEPRGGDH